MTITINTGQVTASFSEITGSGPSLTLWLKTAWAQHPVPVSIKPGHASVLEAAAKSQQVLVSYELSADRGALTLIATGIAVFATEDTDNQSTDQHNSGLFWAEQLAVPADTAVPERLAPDVPF